MMGKKIEDSELLGRCLRGHVESFEIVIGRYQSLVCAITYSATGSIDKSEELAQETFLLAWKNLRQLRDLAKFKAWLCQIARSVVKNWLRDRQRDVVHRAAPLDDASQQRDTASEPLDVVISREQQATVDQALEIIPREYRLPLILFYREEKSSQEVADLLGISENAARQRIARARTLLKEQVAAMVETTLAKSRPGRAFTAGVVASLAGVALRGATSAAAAPAATTGVNAVGTGLSGLGVKLVAVAAGLALIAGFSIKGLHHEASLSRPNSVEAANAIPVDDRAESRPAVNDPPAGLFASSASAPAAPSESEARQESAIPADSVYPEPPSLTAAVPYEFRAKGILSGRLTDAETGQPIADATVRISSARIFDTRTDANGFYAFENIAQAGQYEIAIDAAGHIGIPVSHDNPVVQLSLASKLVKHFKLDPACRVRLSVVDVNGVGIPDAEVIATSPADDSKRIVSYFGRTRKTDADGSLLLGGFAASDNEYLIAVWHAGPYRGEEVNGRTIHYRSYDYAPEKVTVILTDPNVIEERTVVLQKGQVTHGYAEYADGVPVTDVDIIARPVWWHANWTVHGYPVQEDGTFVVKHITPGEYDIAFNLRDAGTIPTILTTSLPLGDDEPLILRLPQKSPQSLVSISGQIHLAGDEQPGSVRVQAYSPQHGHASVIVSSDGYGRLRSEFTLNRLEPGPYRLTFSGNGVEQLVLEAVEAPCADLQVTLTTFEKPSLHGVVFDAASELPVASFRARVMKRKTLRGPNYTQESQWGFFENERGAFSLETVGPGIYQVQILAQGYAPALSAELSTDTPDELEISLTKGGAITGTVVNRQGELVTGAMVIPLSSAGGVTARTQNQFVSEEGAVQTSRGRFTLPHLPAGWETLKVVHPDYAPTVLRKLEVTEGQTHDTQDIVLTSGGALEGFVYDGQGKAMAKEVLYVQDAEDYGDSVQDRARRLATAVTDANGFYRIERLPTHLCYVRRAEMWDRLGVVVRSVIPQEGRITPLHFGGEALVTGIATVDGVPLAKTRLLLGHEGAPDFGSYRCHTETDEKGSFVFRGAIPGRFAIFYREQRDWTQITSVDVPSADLDLGVIDLDTASSRRLSLHIAQPSTGQPWTLSMVYLACPSRRTGSPLHRATAPAKAGQPWSVANPAPGSYTLVLTRLDNLQLHQDITLEPGKQNWEVSLNLPPGSCTVSGSLPPEEIFCLWQEPEGIVVMAQADEHGLYAVGHLPVGTYGVGPATHWLYAKAPVTRLDLSANQSFELDLNPSTWPNEKLGGIIIQVVDSRRNRPADVEMWLSCALGELEPYMSSPLGSTFLAVTGDHLLHVVAAGYLPLTKPVRLDPIQPGTSPANLVVQLHAEE